MWSRRKLAIRIVLIGVAVPGLVAATCTPPTSPPFISLGPGSLLPDEESIPRCSPGFVCIRLRNKTIVAVDIAIYAHDGFDPGNQYGIEVPDPNVPGATIRRACPGATTGDCRITFNQLFRTENLLTVNGQTVTRLQPGEEVNISERCDEIKTIGAAIARANENVLSAPVAYEGPLYREQQCPTGTATIVFVATDANEISVPGFENLVDLVFVSQVVQGR